MRLMARAIYSLVAVTDCSIDQAMFQMLIYDGFHAIGSTAKIHMVNPEYAVMRNGVSRMQDVLWKDGRVVNCRGAVYSMLHQLDGYDGGRHPWVEDLVLKSMGIADPRQK